MMSISSCSLWWVKVRAKTLVCNLILQCSLCLFPLTHIVGDSGVNKVSDKLHDAAVGVSVVQRGGSDGALDDVNDDAAAE